MTVPPTIKARKCACAGRCDCSVMHWTAKLIDAEDARRRAERDYQNVLFQLRGALRSRG